MSATMEAAVSVVPSMVIVPVTAGVRPTAVVDPRPVSSSATRKPTNVPVESSKLNSPTLGSTAHPPATPLEAGAPAEDGTPLDDAAGAVTALSAAVVFTVVWTAPTAASRLTAAGASSRRNQQIPTAASATSTPAPSSTHFNHDLLRGGDGFVIVDVSFTLCSWNKFVDGWGRAGNHCCFGDIGAADCDEPSARRRSRPGLPVGCAKHVFG